MSVLAHGKSAGHDRARIRALLGAAWHADYDDPSPPLSARLTPVRSHLPAAIDQAPVSRVDLATSTRSTLTPFGTLSDLYGISATPEIT